VLPPRLAQWLGTRFLPNEPISRVLVVVSLGYSVGKSGVGVSARGPGVGGRGLGASAAAASGAMAGDPLFIRRTHFPSFGCSFIGLLCG